VPEESYVGITAHLRGGGLKFYLRYKSFTDFPLMIIGFVYLTLYSIQVLVEPAEDVYQILEITSEVIVWLFIADLLVRAVGFGKKLLSIKGLIEFTKHNWLAMLAALVPAFRALRVVRVLIVIRGLAPYLQTRFARVGFIVSVTLPLVLYVSALSVFEAERYAEGSNIETFGEAFWWSLVSVTTVGYGDHFPVTDGGRATAAFLMFVGIGLFSALTALLAAWVLGEVAVKVSEEEKQK
jgi:voltage-gated potassium channel